MKIRLVLAILIMATLTRLALNLLPAPPHNFSPIAAIGLFGAAYFHRRWMAWVVPFAALFISDLFINNVIYKAFFPEFAWITSIWIYVAFAMVIGIGWLILRLKVSPVRIVTASVLASTLFFLVTNLAVWAESPMYAQSPTGLMACFTAAIPFFGNTLAGDLFFSVALFGLYEWMSRRTLVTQRA